MKKATAILLSAVLIVSVAFNAFAFNVTNKVFSDTATAEAGGQITIPVKIENNDGFMGFAIIITYNGDVMRPVSVSKGSMLTGIFNDSIATATNNSFKVVFTGTTDVVSDGVLFDVVFDVSDEASGKYDIELSYSQPDTFKEGWTNAVLNCEAIEVVVTVNGTTAPETTTTAPTTEPSTERDEEGTTKPVTEPSDNTPDDGKPLSVRMREWVNGLPVLLKTILGFFVIPLAAVISIFE